MRTLYGNDKAEAMMCHFWPELEARVVISFGGHEGNTTRMVLALRGDLAVDIGASLGQYTLPLALRFRRVISIEPSPLNLPTLKGYLGRRKFRNIQLLGSAVSDFDGYTELYVNPENVYEGSTIVGRSNRLRSFRVPVLKLDTLLRSESRIDLVKVDAEGAEWAILRGSETVIARIMRWMIELHDVSRRNEFDSLLRSYGYSTRWIDEPNQMPHVFATRNN